MTKRILYAVLAILLTPVVCLRVALWIVTTPNADRYIEAMFGRDK